MKVTMSDILNKVVNDPGNERADAKGGYLNAPQVNTFLDYMWDNTVLGGQVRTERIKGESAELTRIAIGERLLRVATEAVDDGVNAGAAFGKVSISTTKFRLDWELSREALEDGKTGEALEDQIARMMAQQVANDLEDYAINADSSRAGNLSLRGFDGWNKLANETGNVITSSTALDRNVLSAMIKAMPRRAKQNRSALKFFAASNAVQDLLDAEATLRQNVAQDVSTSSNDQISGPLGYTAPRMYGQAIQEVPLFEADASGNTPVWFTDPKNLIWAVQREVQVFREFKPKKDTIEYTVYTRVANQIENLDAAVADAVVVTAAAGRRVISASGDRQRDQSKTCNAKKGFHVGSHFATLTIVRGAWTVT